MAITRKKFDKRLDAFSQKNVINKTELVDLICDYANVRLREDNCFIEVIYHESFSHYIFNAGGIEIKKLSKKFVDDSINQILSIKYLERPLTIDIWEKVELPKNWANSYARNWIIMAGARLYRVVIDEEYKWHKENEYWK